MRDRRVKKLLGAWLLAGLCGLPAGVRADAVPPPPSRCPPGQIGVTSHAGPQCVLPPPKDCPPGWRGTNGGVCLVWSCTSDAQCGDGARCSAADLCLAESLQEWGAADAPVRPLFAGPLQHFDPPRRVVTAVDVCPAARACPKGSECKQGKVCLPSGVSKPGPWTPPAGRKGAAKAP